MQGGAIVVAFTACNGGGVYRQHLYTLYSYTRI
uniref:Uncharacterized protein n=1 Tax=Siphoviridae sp. ctoic9 TaxID=2825671 RepID=A0A8S5Q9Y7_9CAUD|nr:MAG TPA: hypothetical protein [Siphoviridae sp. ctoic9]